MAVFSHIMRSLNPYFNWIPLSTDDIIKTKDRDFWVVLILILTGYLCRRIMMDKIKQSLINSLNPYFNWIPLSTDLEEILSNKFSAVKS